MSQLLRAFMTRSERLSLFEIGVFGNEWMLLASLAAEPTKIHARAWAGKMQFARAVQMELV